MSEQQVTIKGRVPIVVESMDAQNSWFIADASYSGRVLNKSGDWGRAPALVDCNLWESREAAEQFIQQHRDQQAEPAQLATLPPALTASEELEAATIEVREWALPLLDQTAIDVMWASQMLDEVGNMRNQRQFTICHPVNLFALACNGPQCWRLELWCGERKVKDSPTRGDLRLLCRALNIPLNERAEG